MDNKEPNKSGFEMLKDEAFCLDINHSPPTHLWIPQGKQYRHICPTCGKEQVLKSVTVTC